MLTAMHSDCLETAFGCVYGFNSTNAHVLVWNLKNVVLSNESIN